MYRSFWLLALACAAGLAASSPTAFARGWTTRAPAHLVTADSGKRNNVFFAGERVTFTLKGKAATHYEVRDYWGEMIDKGKAGSKLSIAVKRPGWYKLYLRGKPTREPWGDVVGGTMFAIFRKDDRFPALPPPGTSGGSHGALDEVLRGVTGMGPQRHKADADKPDETIRNLEKDLAIDQKMYLPFDPARKRVLMVAFPNGTKNLAGVRKIVERFKDVVAYWEPRNEPNFRSKSAADFVTGELKPFYETIKKVDPKLKVLGPGTVSINPNLQRWLKDFFEAGGAKYIDAFSFHAYNCVNGDVWLARTSLGSLGALLKKYRADKLEKWQTEQGYFAAVYGSYQPRLQGRWTMVQMMVYEQYGIPKEHNHLWYDRSHGFWDFPTWWENDDGSPNPAVALMRVWSEELYGKQFVKAFDFGELGNKLTIGSLFAGGGKEVAAFQSVGSTDGKVELKVTGGDRLRLVSAFGVEEELPVKGGRVVLPVPELPVYVELAKGQALSVVPLQCGPNLARVPGVTAASSGVSRHPANKADTPQNQRINNDIGKIVNGTFENWYWAQKKDDQPWMSNVEKFPAWVEVRLPKPTQVARVIVCAAPPWQWQGTLLKYEVQCEVAGKWVTVDRVDEPAKVLKVFTPPTRTSVDSFFSDRWIFQHTFAPVTTTKVRLLVHEVTWGGGATRQVGEAGGQTGFHQIVLREVELYGK